MAVDSLPDVALAISSALARAAAEGALPDSEETMAAATAGSSMSSLEEERLLQKPVGMFYDLTAWEANLSECSTAFGRGFFHAAALKSNGVGPMVERLRELGFGAECASIGEVTHAERYGLGGEEIVFDSPAKTPAEIRYALEKGIHINVDNFQELDVVSEIRHVVSDSKSIIGVRVNPVVGAGEIAALSVSVAESKFGIPIEHRRKIIEAYVSRPWLNCIHVHVGSGGMGSLVLVAGIKKIVELALEINKEVGMDQVCVFDMGGGMPVNYGSDAWHTEKVPSFHSYATSLKENVPQLFPQTPGSPFRRVVTEFGQSLQAKAGWLASRIQYTKPLPDNKGQIAVILFGADACMRQCYTNDHKRRVELFDGKTMKRKIVTPECPEGDLHVAGPLCFEGDHLAKDLRAPMLSRGDVVVLREAGANTLSLFSRHCQRQVPAVYGYKWRKHPETGVEIVEWVTLKTSEDLEGCSKHWGWNPKAQQVKINENN